MLEIPSQLRELCLWARGGAPRGPYWLVWLRSHVTPSPGPPLEPGAFGPFLHKKQIKPGAEDHEHAYLKCLCPATARSSFCSPWNLPATRILLAIWRYNGSGHPGKATPSVEMPRTTWREKSAQDPEFGRVSRKPGLPYGKVGGLG